MTVSDQELIKKAAIRIKQLQARLQEQTQPIAIVGLACRFPGAKDKDAFWRLLIDRVDAVSEVPRSRWDVNAYYDPDPDAPGKTSTRWGGFIDDIDQFDPAFFAITPREAADLDPQQRLLLEGCWHALEDAGMSPQQLAGSRTGVYAGLSTSDYCLVVTRGGVHGIGSYVGTGLSHSVAVGRVSFALGLQGPSLAVDTACSSSLVAIHQACRGLLNGDCELALAGGVNAMLTPELMIYFSKGRFMAADGRCKSFDAAADGYVRGEGCGVVVLKRLSDARRDGDRIYAVVHGSAVNHDGRSSGLTVPNGPAQERVIADALAWGQVEAAAVGYVEAHGTGTALGDPIEIQALHNALGRARPKGRPLLVGSVKTNIGHLEAAAGVAGVIKVALALQHGVIPGQLHFKNPSPRINWDAVNVRVVTGETAWPDGCPLGGVSSFAFQGTNAHVVLSPPEPVPVAAQQPDRAEHVLPLSARTERALRELEGMYAAWLDEHPEASPADVCFTAGVGRSHFEYRAAIPFESREQLRATLAQLSDGQSAHPAFTGHARARPKLALLFTGQGSQYPGMAKGLYDTQPVFRDTLGRCAELLEKELDRPLLDVLFFQEDGTATPARGDAGNGKATRGPLPLDDTRYAQPALFAVEVALYELYKSWGLQPAAVLGHSLGEYAAAYAAGVFGLADGIRLVARRGRLMGALPAGGGMAAVFAPAAEVEAAVAAAGAGLAVAAYNGAHTVVSGPRGPLEALLGRFAARGVRCARLPAGHAFHSPLVEPALEAFERAAAAVAYRPAELPLLSNVSGRPLPAGAAPDAAYWVRHAREPVQWARAVASLAELGCTALLELGPQPTLAGLALACWPAGPAPAAVAALRRGEADDRQAGRALAELYAAGLTPDFAAWDRPWPRRKLALPSYPFQRQRFWAEPPARRAIPGQPDHPLLGVKHTSARGQVTYDQTLSLSEQEWLRDHRVFGVVVVPGTWFACAALAASEALPARLLDGQLRRALVLKEGEEVLLQFAVQPAAEGPTQTQFEVFSRPGGAADWLCHAAGQIAAGPHPATPPKEPLTALRSRLTAQDVAAFYARCAETGVVYEPHFAGIVELSTGDGEALGVIETPAGLKPRDLPLHPAVLDACWQVSAAAFGSAPAADPYVPYAWQQIDLLRKAPARVVCYARRREATPETVVADLWLLDEQGQLFGQITGLSCKRVTRQTLLGGHARIDDWFYEMQWPERPLVGRVVPADFWPPPSDLAAAVRPEAGTLLAESGMDLQAQSELAEDLERLSRAYVIQALAALGWMPRQGERVDVASLERLGVRATHRKLSGRLLEILGAAGVLERSGEQWQVLRALEPVDPGALHRTLVARHPAARIELTLLGRCGEHLGDVLTGTADPLELLFPRSGISAEHLYRDAPGARIFNQLIQRTVRHAVAHLPAGRQLRVLEVGAGTGGATGSVLEALPKGKTQYAYTDLSAAFFGAAKERFAAGHPFITYQVLDIERDPVAQGFPAHQYDLILASNVLHATRDIERAVAHCGRLLAPAGLLVLQEGLRRQGWLDLTFGLLEGWWRFNDSVRRDYALLDPHQWSEVLARQGFTQTEAIHPDGVDHQAVLVARAPDVTVAHEGAGLWVLAADRGGVAERLADRLTRRGQVCIVVERGEAFEMMGLGAYRLHFERAEDWRQLLGRLPAGPPLRGVVQLAALDATESRVTTGETLKTDSRHAGASTLALVQALAKANASPTAGLWLLTQGAQSTDAEPCTAIAAATLWGMAKSISLEHPDLHCRCVDVDHAVCQLDALADELLTPDEEDQVAWRGDRRLVARLVRSSQVPGRVELPTEGVYRLAKGIDRTLEGLHMEALELPPPGAGEVQVEVRAAGLNFRDLFDTLGLHPGDAGPLGGELAGRIVALGEGVLDFAVGDEVAGLGAGCFANRVNTPVCLLARKPPRISAAEAATLPVAYLTAQMAFGLAQLRAGERVLIHAASGGVGQAAVQLARLIGAEVFATASLPKQDYLRSLGIAHVYDSRSTKFGEQILADTGGAGVDVVLNSLTGEGFIEASLRCLSPNGRFVEIAKRNIWTAEQVRAARPEVAYHILAVDRLSGEQPQRVGEVLRQVVAGVAAGDLHPLRHSVYPLAEVRAAMRYMQEAKHIGKVVLSVPPLAARSLRGDRTYLVTGGLGGLGLEVARWLADRGAKHIALNGRREPEEYANRVLRALRSRGLQVRVILADVTAAEQVERMLGEIDATMPPLGGVIHSVGLLRDGALLNQTWERFEQVLAPKVLGGWHLHQLTRDRDLDLFVLFASTAGLLGNHGQANHAAANALLDQLARHRRSAGRPAVAIDWGAWAKTGEAAERAEQIRSQLAAAGIGWIEPSEGLAALERVLSDDRVQVGVSPIDWQRFAARLTRRPPLLQKLLAAPLAKANSPPASQSLQRLQHSSAEDHHGLLVRYLAEQVQRVLQLKELPDAKTGFFDLGMDSLMAVELRNRLNTDLKLEPPLSTNALFDHPTVHALAVCIENQGPGPAKLTTVDGSRQPHLVEVTPAPADRHRPFPLSDIQEAYLVGRQVGLEDGGVSCHFYIEEEGRGTDPERLNRAWDRLIERHDMLRAVILPDCRQRVLERVPPYAFGVLDLRDRGRAEQDAGVESVRQQMSHRLSDPERWPLFDIRLTLLSEGRVRLHVSFDLLIADAASLLLLFREWALLYEHPEAVLPPIGLTFRDCLFAEVALRESEAYARARAYWWERLATLPAAPELPLAGEQAEGQPPRFVRRVGRLAPERWQRLKARAVEFRLTPSALLYAAYAEVLAAWSKSPRFTLVLTLFNRPFTHPELSLVVGDFTSTVLLEVNRGAGSFVESAQRLQLQLARDLDHSAVSGVRVLRELNRRRAPERRIMPVVFTSLLGHQPTRENARAGLTVLNNPVYGITQTPQVWLDLQMREERGGLYFNLDALEARFPAGLLDDLFGAYCRLLELLADNEKSWTDHLVLVPPSQLELRAQVNATTAAVPATLLQTLVSACAARPAQPAVVSPGGCLSYAELEHRSRQLGRVLRGIGARRNRLVAVVLEKGWEQVVAVLGVLHAGAAYLPLDPELPAERLRALLEFGEVEVAVTVGHLSARLAWPEGVRRLCLDELRPTAEEPPLEPLQEPSDLAYVIFTSGSTGAPKGVMIDHRGAVNTILDINRRFGVGPEDRVLALSSLTFDLSVYDIFGILAAGGTVVFPAPRSTCDPSHWVELVERERVTVWNSVPALMRLVAEYLAGRPTDALRSLRLVMLSGDWIPVNLPDQVRAAAERAQVVSLGGATEASIWSIYYPITRTDPKWKSVPYGRPLANQTLHVLNADFDPCPVWVAGELYIGGLGLALGYWRDEEKTRARFVVHPRTGERLYRTGDWGRYLPDGDIEFLGRDDLQVKVQGYRIELTEVEAALLAHPKVTSAVAAAVGKRGEEMRLVAYLAPREPLAPTNGTREPVALPTSGRRVLVEDVRTFLRGKLPAYMVPTDFVVLDELPLTANGKVDRRALIDPPAGTAVVETTAPRRGGSLSAPRGSTEPSADFEQALTQIIRDLTGQKTVGAHDSFFDLGVSSLGIVRIQRRLRELTGLEVEIADIFENPSVRLLSNLVGPSPSSSPRPPANDQTTRCDCFQFGSQAERAPGCLVELRRGRRPRASGLFFLPDFTGELSGLQALITALDDDCSCFGLQPTLAEEEDPVQWSRNWAKRYEAAVRARQPNGPYLLVGYSMGGPFALELAHTLSEGGRDPVAVALLDSRPGKSVHESAAIQELSALEIVQELRSSTASGLDSLLSVLGKIERAGRSGKIPPGLNALRLLQQLAALEHVPARAYSFPVLLLRGEIPLPGDRPDEDEAFGWSRYCKGDFEVRVIPGDHFAMVRHPHVRVAADRLEDWLRAMSRRWNACAEQDTLEPVRGPARLSGVEEG